jgi:hypothetical protein
MPKSRPLAARTRAVSIDEDEIRRTLGRRFVFPLIAASLILWAEMALLKNASEPAVELRATPGPAVDAPVFVRPPKPAPDVLIGARIRLA